MEDQRPGFFAAKDAERLVPRHKEGGASAPPDAPLTPHGEAELQRKIRHYREQLEADTAAVQPRCIHHHVLLDANNNCYICDQERPRHAHRVTTHDDNHSIYISTHNTPITPEQAIRLAANLLTAALRILDRRDTGEIAARDNAVQLQRQTPSHTVGEETDPPRER